VKAVRAEGRDIKMEQVSTHKNFVQNNWEEVFLVNLLLVT